MEPIRDPPIRDPEMLKRMELAFDLAEAAEEIMRQNLRRRSPRATEEEIEAGIREWYGRRPGAEHGDGVGRPGNRFERTRRAEEAPSPARSECSGSARR